MTLGDRIVIMKDGFIQQIGTPQEVFNHPKNLFVAGFIGTPQMNFFNNAKLIENGGKYAVEILGHAVELTAEQNAALASKGVRSMDIVAGVRPVHVTLGDAGIDGKVEVSEMMGSELHLHMNAGGQDVVAVVPTTELEGKNVSNGSAVKFDFSAKLIHLFNKETEENLL